jgi:hypothetical protein
VRAGDVLWVFGRMRALGRDWPPSLVARMQIAETHPGPRGWEEWKRHAGDGTRPGFPFADAHRFYASATGSRFYPYGNAVPALLALGYGGGRAPTELLTSADDDVLTIDGARRAWRRASLTEEGVTRFRSLRRIHDTSIGHLDGFAASIDVHSAFVSYRWAEGRGERSDAARADELLADLAERLVEDGLAIWLDRLLLPPSPLQRRRGDPVLSRILADGITRARLLVAVVTARYGGPSRRDAPGARSAVRRGYTALEWAGAADVPRVRWDLEPCEFEHELSGRADVRLTARHAAGDVARTARQLLV